MEVFNILKVVRAPECISTKLEILTARYVFPLFFWQEFWLPDINHKFLTYSYIIWSLTLTEFYNLHQKCYIILVGTVQRIKIGRIEKMIAKILKIMNKTYLILYSLSTKCFFRERKYSWNFKTRETKENPRADILQCIKYILCSFLHIGFLVSKCMVVSRN